MTLTTAVAFSPVAGLISNREFLEEIANADLPMVNTNKNILYYNVPAAFDIEVSSFYQYGEKRACMYVWQFGILNWVTYGRTWEEYESLVNKITKILGLSSDCRLPVYVHNLAYEFQFMRKHFEWDKVFLLKERKPVRALSSGMEYRCSLKLSSKALAKVGDDLQKYKVQKLVGDLDYNLVRTSETELTEKELGYCENDIRVVLAYIQEKIESDGDVTLIPLTNTGYVRNYCRKACFSRYKRYKRIMSELELDGQEYQQLKRGFGGGFTHASAKYSGEILHNVGSFDFTSSYPAVMLAEKFPMSRGELIEHINDSSQLDWYLHHRCCLFDVTFHDLIPVISTEHPISSSRVIRSEGMVRDNGRVVTAKSVTLTCTEQDFFTYEKFYHWETMDIHTFRVYKKGYLPTAFVKSILELYKRKTTLKGVEGEEVNYMISKNMLNACFGMTVTDIVRDEISYENDTFKTTKPDLEDAVNKYNNNKRRFLFYPWGVWITAYARANLFSGILACGDDYVYSDTDSIKVLNPEKHWDYINWYNEQIKVKLDKAADFHHIDPGEFSPLNQKGVAKPLGVWDYEGTYDRFKTLGAKRYLVEEDGKVHLTTAGLNKKTANDYLCSFPDPFEAFSPNLVFPPSHSGRLTLTYFDEGCSGMVKDYQGNLGEYDELSYIHMEPSEYEITISAEYEAFLKYIKGIMEDSW